MHVLRTVSAVNDADPVARVLVAEDDRSVRESLVRALRLEGYDVTAVTDGEQALEHMESDTPDLIILDIMMPVMDGYTLNMRLQANPKTQGIPILVLTAKGQKMRDLFEMAPNVAAYVQKPFDPKMLRELIAGILSSRKDA